MSSLWLVEGPAGTQPRHWWIPPAGITIGQHASSEVRLVDSTVSKRHARIHENGDVFLLTDLRSHNRTRLHGVDLPPDQPAPLANDDEFTIVHGRHDMGRYRFVFRLRDPVRVVGADDLEPTKSFDMSPGSMASKQILKPEEKLQSLMAVVESLRDSSIRSDLSLQTILHELLDRLFLILPQAGKALCYVQGPSVGPRPVVAYRYNPKDTSPSPPSIRSDVLADLVAGRSVSGDGGRIIATPLMTREGQNFGYLQLIARRNSLGDEFSKDHLDVLAMIGHLVAFAIENHLFYMATVQSQGMRREMELARQIQRKLLPSTVPTIKGYEFFHTYRPAKYVGGDYFDYLPLEDGRIAIALGDVAGKGVPAGMLASMVASELRMLLDMGQSPSESLGRINNRMMVRGVDSTFVTLCLLILDPRTHEVDILNAGHMRPILRHANGMVSQPGDEVVGLPVGVLDDQVYDPHRLRLEPGDCLTLYTDGITDAVNRVGLRYDTTSTPRLCEQFVKPIHSAEELGNRILHDVERFVDDTPQCDDICLVCLRRAP